jgi:RING-variant domain
LQINEGDYILLGRVRIKIKEINLEDPVEGESEKKGNSDLLSNYIQENVEGLSLKKNVLCRQESSTSQSLCGAACRICLSNEEAEGPLISPCKCSGSMQYIHIGCLQKWLASRLEAKTTSYSISFTLKNFECELCKSMFPRNDPKLA